MIEPPRLFVYGTLQPGRLRWSFLEPFATGFRPATVGGRLCDSGKGWPAAVFGAGGDRIPGTTVDLDPGRTDEALRLLDGVEGSVDGLFVRIAVVTDADERAWAYQWGRSLDGLTRIDRWDRTAEA
ncbi:MAG: gamma-glutamylcyclotransferase family protein [Acidimicrobiales bacterium]